MAERTPTLPPAARWSSEAESEQRVEVPGQVSLLQKRQELEMEGKREDVGRKKKEEGGGRKREEGEGKMKQLRSEYI